MSAESHPHVPSQPSAYEGLPEAWFDSSANIGEPRQFRAPYAFNEVWQEIVTDLEQLEDSAYPGCPQLQWHTEVTHWPRGYDCTTYLGATFKNNADTQSLFAYWDNTYHHDIIDTLNEIPGTSILKAIVGAHAYHTYRKEPLQLSYLELYTQRQPVLSSNKPLNQQINRYKKRENVPQNVLRLPLSGVDYVWTPQRDAFLADYSLRPNALGNPAEVSTDEFFEIARAIAALIVAE